MWNRRDLLTVSISAVAAFGITVGLFLPRLANAVDDRPVATADVKVPTLNLGAVHVTAALDPRDAHKVLLMVVNTGDEPATASFKAHALMVGPMSALSRGMPRGQEVWQQEWTIDLKAGETRTLAEALPDAAFVAPQPPAPNQNPATPQNAVMMTIPGNSYLQLAGTADNPPVIRALTLSTGKANDAAAAMPVRTLTPASSVAAAPTKAAS